MFSKKQPKLDTIVGPESSMRGDLTSKGTIRIDGKFEGNLSADCIIIGEGGSLNGDVTAREIVIAGRVVGNVHSTEGVDIQRNGEVSGDIFAARLAIAEGGSFDGRSTMQLQKKISYTADEKPVELA